jgi:glycerol uptake facilitator protein
MDEHLLSSPQISDDSWRCLQSLRGALRRPHGMQPGALLREAVAEGLGTFVMMLFGLGVCAQTTLSIPAPPAPAPAQQQLHHQQQQQPGLAPYDCTVQYATAGSELSINLAWGLAVFFGIVVAGGVSGAHLNPAVSLALCAHGRFPARKLAPFAAAQLGGSFAAAATVFANYADGLAAFEAACRGGRRDLATAGIFATYNNAAIGESVANGFADQVLGTALLLAGIFALGDAHNNSSGGGGGGAGGGAGRLAGAAATGALVVAIGMCFGLNAGYAINPARDLPPRVLTALAGWGWAQVFTPYAFVPVVAPCVGALLGSTLYEALVGWHTPAAARVAAAAAAVHPAAAAARSKAELGSRV